MKNLLAENITMKLAEYIMAILMIIIQKRNMKGIHPILEEFGGLMDGVDH